jgi:holin-like protein
MIKTFALLLVYQCLGELVAFVASLPIPGAVIGMLLLLASLRLNPGLASAIGSDCLAFLKLLPLLFVPAGTGIIVFADRFGDDLLPITTAVILSTVLTISMTALVGQGLCALWRPTEKPVNSAQQVDESIAPALENDSKVGTR